MAETIEQSADVQERQPADPMGACGDWIAHQAMLTPGFDDDFFEALDEYGRQCDAERMTSSLFGDGEF